MVKIRRQQSEKGGYNKQTKILNGLKRVVKENKENPKEAQRFKFFVSIKKRKERKP